MSGTDVPGDCLAQSLAQIQTGCVYYSHLGFLSFSNQQSGREMATVPVEGRGCDRDLEAHCPMAAHSRQTMYVQDMTQLREGQDNSRPSPPRPEETTPTGR
jgi:hypothetical protein